jgi:hypothetical protein
VCKHTFAHRSQMISKCCQAPDGHGLVTSYYTNEAASIWSPCRMSRAVVTAHWLSSCHVMSWLLIGWVHVTCCRDCSSAEFMSRAVATAHWLSLCHVMSRLLIGWVFSGHAVHSIATDHISDLCNYKEVANRFQAPPMDLFPTLCIM